MNNRGKDKSNANDDDNVGDDGSGTGVNIFFKANIFAPPGVIFLIGNPASMGEGYMNIFPANS